MSLSAAASNSECSNGTPSATITTIQQGAVVVTIKLEVRPRTSQDVASSSISTSATTPAMEEQPTFHRFSGSYTFAELRTVVAHLAAPTNADKQGESEETAKNLTLQYTDDEGDQVQLSSEAEWQECLRVLEKKNTLTSAKKDDVSFSASSSGGSPPGVLRLVALTNPAPAHGSKNAKVTAGGGERSSCEEIRECGSQLFDAVKRYAETHQKEKKDAAEKAAAAEAAATSACRCCNAKKGVSQKKGKKGCCGGGLPFVFFLFMAGYIAFQSCCVIKVIITLIAVSIILKKTVRHFRSRWAGATATCCCCSSSCSSTTPTFCCRKAVQGTAHPTALNTAPPSPASASTTFHQKVTLLRELFPEMPLQGAQEALCQSGGDMARAIDRHLASTTASSTPGTW